MLFRTEPTTHPQISSDFVLNFIVIFKSALGAETHVITLPMLRVLSSKAQELQYFWEPSKPCHFGIYLTALTEYSHMSTHLPGFQSIFTGFLHHFILARLATSSIRVKERSMHGRVKKPACLRPTPAHPTWLLSIGCLVRHKSCMDIGEVKNNMSHTSYCRCETYFMFWSKRGPHQGLEKVNLIAFMTVELFHFILFYFTSFHFFFLNYLFIFGKIPKTTQLLGQAPWQMYGSFNSFRFWFQVCHAASYPLKFSFS